MRTIENGLNNCYRPESIAQQKEFKTTSKSKENNKVKWKKTKRSASRKTLVKCLQQNWEMVRQYHCKASVTSFLEEKLHPLSAI